MKFRVKCKLMGLSHKFFLLFSTNNEYTRMHHQTNQSTYPKRRYPFNSVKKEMSAKKAVFHLTDNAGSMLLVEAKPEKPRMGRAVRDDPTGAIRRDRERKEAAGHHLWLPEGLPGETATIEELELRLREYKFTTDRLRDSRGNYAWGFVAFLVLSFVDNDYVKGIRLGDPNKKTKLDVIKNRLSKGIIHVQRFENLDDLSKSGEFRATEEEIDAFWDAFIHRVKTTMKKKSGHERATAMAFIDRFIVLYGQPKE